MAIFTIKSTDVGAPVIQNTTGAAITLFDYALVTIAGYTKLFSGTNRAIYKPPAGLGYCFSIIHDTGTPANVGNFTVRGCEGATDINTLINPYPSYSQHDNLSSLWMLNNSSGQTLLYYVIVSDGRDNIPPFILFLPRHVNTSDYSFGTYMWGEASALEPVDNYASFIFFKTSAHLSNSTANLLNSCTTLGQTSAMMYWARSRDGAIISSRGYINSIFSTIGGSTVGPAYPHPDTGGLQRQKVILSDGYTTNPFNGASVGEKPTIARALLPCIWASLHKSGASSYNGLNSMDTFTDSAYNINSNFLFVLCASGSSGVGAAATIVETSNTWTKD